MQMVNREAQRGNCSLRDIRASLRSYIFWNVTHRQWIVTSWVVSGSMYVGVTLRCGYGGVVSVCRLKHYCFSLHTDTTPP